MRSADGGSRLSLWLRVREFAVPPSMIDTATARRERGDWAGACAAARADVDLDLRALARRHGGRLAVRVRDDLRHLAPDLLRWHLPRIAPDGLLRPATTVSLARYGDGLHLVARTPPAWADAGQRFSLAIWDRDPAAQHPSRRFRFDLHRHLWDARRAAELHGRSGGPDRWPAEARLLRDADKIKGDTVSVRWDRRRFLLGLTDGSVTPARTTAGHPPLPEPAVYEPPDLALLRAGLIEPGALHPLIAPAARRERKPVREPGRIVDCRGVRHRIGLLGGALVPFDHTPDEIRREDLLAALGGTPLPCLRAIDEAHRDPADLADIRARLDHGDTPGAIAAVQALLGPAAVLRDGALTDELATAAARRVTYGLFRNGMAGYGPPRERSAEPRRRNHR